MADRDTLMIEIEASWPGFDTAGTASVAWLYEEPTQGLYLGRLPTTATRADVYLTEPDRVQVVQTQVFVDAVMRRASTMTPEELRLIEDALRAYFPDIASYGELRARLLACAAELTGIGQQQPDASMVWDVDGLVLINTPVASLQAAGIPDAAIIAAGGALP